MPKPAVSHIVVHVSDVARAHEFYVALFRFLKLKQIYSEKTSFAYYNSSLSVWVSRASKPGKFSRGKAGYDHIALRASSRKQVDELERMLKRERVKILYPAKEYKEFMPGYYAVSFMDPDGTIWEFLHLPKGKGYG